MSLLALRYSLFALRRNDHVGCYCLRRLSLLAKSEERKAESDSADSRLLEQMRIIRIARVDDDLLVGMPALIPARLNTELRKQ